MWPGVDPRVGLPLSLGGVACYGWLLAELRPSAAWAWWGLVGFVALVSVALAGKQWRENCRVADALAGRTPVDAELAARIDRLAGHVDFSGRLSVWSPPLAVFFIASTGLRATLDRGDLLFLVPLVGIVVYALLSVLLLRRRNRQVEHWLGERPGQPGWWTVPPS